MPCTLPAASPPWLASGSIFTAPNVERHRPSARSASICCGGGGAAGAPSPLGPLAGWFWLELEDDVAEPAAATHAASTATIRAIFPTLSTRIAASIPPGPARAAQDRASGVV